MSKTVLTDCYFFPYICIYFVFCTRLHVVPSFVKSCLSSEIYPDFKFNKMCNKLFQIDKYETKGASPVQVVARTVTICRQLISSQGTRRRIVLQSDLCRCNTKVQELLLWISPANSSTTCTTVKQMSNIQFDSIQIYERQNASTDKHPISVMLRQLSDCICDCDVANKLVPLFSMVPFTLS